MQSDVEERGFVCQCTECQWELLERKEPMKIAEELEKKRLQAEQVTERDSEREIERDRVAREIEKDC